MLNLFNAWWKRKLTITLWMSFAPIRMIREVRNVLQVSSARRQAAWYTYSTSNPTYAILLEPLEEKDVNYDSWKVIDSNKDDHDVIQVSSARKQASWWTYFTWNPTHAIFFNPWWKRISTIIFWMPLTPIRNRQQ